MGLKQKIFQSRGSKSSWTQELNVIAGWDGGGHMCPETGFYIQNYGPWFKERGGVQNDGTTFSTKIRSTHGPARSS